MRYRAAAVAGLLALWAFVATGWAAPTVLWCPSTVVIGSPQSACADSQTIDWIYTASWTKVLTPDRGWQLRSDIVTPTAYPFTTTPSPPAPPPDPTWAGGQQTLTWTAATLNMDGTAIRPPVTYRVTVGGCTTRAIEPAVSPLLVQGLPAGTCTATVAAKSLDGYSVETGPVSWVSAPPSVCGALPAPETQTVQCPAGFTGSWTQTRTYASAAYPTCSVAGAWTPGSAPTGACVAIPPPPVTPVVVAVVPGLNMAPVFGITSTNARGSTVLGFVPVGKPCSGSVVYTYRGKGYRRVANADVLWWQSTPTTAAAVACQ